MTVIVNPTDLTLASDEAYNGVQFKHDDGDITDVSVLLDLDMRTGTPISETGWLSGNTGGSYPGSLTGFQASNSDGNAVGSMRMMTIQLDLEAAAVEPLIITAGVSKILAIIGTSMPLADKTLSVSFTNTGLDNGASAPTNDPSTGTLPCLLFHAEAAVDKVTVTFMCLG